MKRRTRRWSGRWSALALWAGGALLASACSSSVDSGGGGLGGMGGSGGATSTDGAGGSGSANPVANAGGGGTDPAATGMGGTDQVATGAGGSGEAWYCAPGEFDDRPECCTVADHMPCKGLPEAECAALEHCMPIEGIPWNMDFDDPEAAPSFVGCRSLCLGVEAPAYNCGYHPSDPQTCYKVTSEWLPDGWTEIFECDVPPGLCGTSP